MAKRKIFILLCIFIGLNMHAASKAFMQSIGYKTSYSEALNEAKNKNLPIMMVISTTSCPWCRKFERQTLRKKSIKDAVRESFVPLALTRDVDTYPEQFDAKVVPTVFFINPDNEEFFDKSLGYKNRIDYKKVLQKAAEKYKK
jgi:thioredoxin-related protein